MEQTNDEQFQLKFLKEQLKKAKAEGLKRYMHVGGIYEANYKDLKKEYIIEKATCEGWPINVFSW